MGRSRIGGRLLIRNNGVHLCRLSTKNFLNKNSRKFYFFKEEKDYTFWEINSRWQNDKKVKTLAVK